MPCIRETRKQGRRQLICDRLVKETWYSLKMSFSPLEFKVGRAEVKISMMFIAEHHIPIAVMDHLSPLLTQCFSNSKTAASFAACRTKTSCIINDAIAPSLLQSVTYKLKLQPFSLSVDSSNDSGL